MPKRTPRDWETLERELHAAGVSQAEIEAGARRLLAEARGWLLPRNWPPPSGSPAMSISPVFLRPVMTPATGRWTGCSASGLSWRGKSTIR